MSRFFIFVIMLSVFFHDQIISALHTCSGKIKDCTKKEIYDQEKCSCVCRKELKADCLDLSTRMIWKEEICSCACRNTQNCDPNYQFDQDMCKCVPVPRFITEKALSAVCEPHLEVVPFKSENGSVSKFNPPCTRIKRCSGCCGGSKASCQPTIFNTRHFEVIESNVLANGTHSSRKVIKELLEHLECECGCNLQPEHCTKEQSYDGEDCECYCVKDEEKHFCSQFRGMKQWNNRTCSCECENQSKCPKGFHFNNVTCKCSDLRPHF